MLFSPNPCSLWEASSNVLTSWDQQVAFDNATLNNWGPDQKDETYYGVMPVDMYEDPFKLNIADDFGMLSLAQISNLYS
jgi:hypothetical protein